MEIVLDPQRKSEAMMLEVAASKKLIMKIRLIWVILISIDLFSDHLKPKNH